MRHLSILLAAALTVASAAAGEVGFTGGPTAARDGDTVKITFAVSEPTDVEVAVLDAAGKVARHLAAGALGAANPPPAPLKAGLAQQLVWNGKDDAGNAAVGGPFRVRVRAGMGARFGRMVADSPHNLSSVLCRGLVVDPANGDVYYMGSHAALRFLRVYDRTGKYLREILPYPATLATSDRRPFGVIELPDGRVLPRSYYSLWPAFYPFARGLGHDDGKRPEAKLAAINPADGTLLLMSEQFNEVYRIRKADGGAAGEPFKERLWPRGTKLPGYRSQGPVMGTVSRDGKTYYFAGFAGAAPKGAKLHPTFPDGRVYQARRGADGAWHVETFADIPLPPGAPALDAKWSIAGHSCSLHGVAADASGRVFVCDAANGKVWAFAADGKVIGSVDVLHAYMAAVDEKSGALYVLTRKPVRPHPRGLKKLDGWKAGAKVVASLDFPAGRGSWDPFLAVDLTGTRPQLWLAGCPEQRSLLRIEDTGDELKVLEDLADRGRTAAGFAARMVVDKAADLVYVNDGVATNLRYNGRTGKYAGQLDRVGRPVAITGSEFCVRADGMIYRLAGKSWKGRISRLNRDLTPAPLPDGSKEFGWYYGRMGGGYFGNHGCAVAPDGRLLMMGMYTWCQYAVMEFGPDGKPSRRPWLSDYEWAGDFAKAGINSALVGWLPTMCGGVAIGPDEHVYVGLGLLPREHKLPEAMESIRGYRRMTGSVIKFKPAGGAVHPDDGRNGQTWKNGNVTMKIPDEFTDGIRMGATRTQHGVWLRKTFIEGGVRAYAGLAPFSGFDRSDACVCQTPRFDVDGFGRVYIPNALTCSVTVVDDAGNAILRFGEYGNFDGTRSGIPLAYPICVGVSVKSIYVADSANRRVVRVDPTWAAEAVIRAK